MKVRNVNGAALSRIGSSGLLAYWEKASGQNASMCFASGCINRPSVGGRVQRDSPDDKSWYVIPLCAACNDKKGQELEIWDVAKLVPVLPVVEADDRPLVRHPGSHAWYAMRSPSGPGSYSEAF